MSDNKQAAVRYQFNSAVDLLAVFERLGIEYVEVSNERTIVIYQRTIFNVDVLAGHLNTAQTVEIEVFDISPDLDVDTDPLSLIQHLVTKLATRANVDRERQDYPENSQQ